MAKNNKIAELEQAVETQAASLEPAQYNFVMAQFDHYKWNEDKIAELEKQLESGVVNGDGIHDYDSEGKVFRQRHQLVAEQGTLFSHIMRWLKGTAATTSEIDKFIS